MATTAQPPSLPQRPPVPKLKRAVWLAMVAMSVFFLVLAYADLERHGLAGAAYRSDWLTPPLAAMLSANTAVLVASSLALRRARQYLRLRRLRACLRWLATAFALGLGFLAGQAIAWRSLLAAGVYVAAQPNSAFFYLITAAHAAHLLVALALLGWLLTRAWRGRLQPDRPLLMDLTAILWHFLDATWVYLYVVLLYWR
ncbi:MAG TPA: cytochrome c oxidase subunit 3 [Terriglobales bacterium]|nr:cytochrome c oxidase subunit 3 [Terriglobales bacterium]